MLAGALIASVLVGPGQLDAQARRAGVLEVVGCPGLEDAVLREALAAELSGLEVEGATLDLRIECLGGDVILLSADDAWTRPRALEVNDVAPPLRARLVALALAEILLVRTARADAPAAGPVAPSPIAPNPIATDLVATEARRAALPNRALLPRASALGLPDGPGRRARSAIVRVSLDGTRVDAPLWAVIARGLLRAFPGHGTLLGGGDLLLRVGPVGVGAHGSAAPSVSDPLGDLIPSLVLGTAELTVVCADHEVVETCAGFWVGVGAAAAEARANSTAAGRSLEAPYVEAGLRVSSTLVLGLVAIGIEVGLGWSAGLIALADTREVLALDGLVSTVALSLEILP